MNEIHIGTIESKFADIIWKMEPVESPELVKIAEKELNWKKSTTYTVLKRLCEKGIFKMEDSVVTALISRQEFEGLQSEQFVEENFKGSLPAFLAAFTARRKLSDKEIDEMKELIEQMRR